MKCMSCEVEINPKWKHAININVCPFCGASIMEEHLKNLFSSLSETMENLSVYRDQLDDWLLSNHNYIRTDSEKIIQYLPKDHIDNLVDAAKRKEGRKFTDKIIKENGEEEEVIVEKIQSDEKTQDFYKRAGISTKTNITEKKEKFKEMVKEIKRNGITSLLDSNDVEIISSDKLGEADPEIVSEFESALSGSDVIQSSLPDHDGGEEIPSVVANWVSRASNSPSQNNDSSHKDLMKLKNLHSKSRRGLEDGKGGFSR